MKINEIIVEASLKQRLKTGIRKIDPTIRSRIATRAADYGSEILGDPAPGERFGPFNQKAFRNMQRLDRLSRGENPWKDKKSYTIPIVTQDTPKIVVVDLPDRKQRVVVSNEGSYYSFTWRTPGGKKYYEKASMSNVQNMNDLMDIITREVAYRG